ncbi:MAG: CPBP family intramembrane metalloprotease [Candidatus Eremiobacteraeota bacterium]|nr:CPBP family intramembrane metalloprotease [Candidatus Eremiobacteraeota bacterium]
MNWSTVWTVLYHELRMVFRDHRTIVLSVILPIGLMPILLMTAQAIHARRAGANSQPIYLYCLQGDPSPKLRQFLARRLNGREFKESLEDRAEQALLRGDIDFILFAETTQETLEREQKERPQATSAEEKRPASEAHRLKGVPVIRIAFRADQDRSIRAYQEIREALTDIKAQVVEEHLANQGFFIPKRGLFVVEEHNLATNAEVTGAMLGPYMTAFVVLLLLGGGSVAAMDILAGEKERGSMETLLTSAARREEIVLAKQLAVLAVAGLIAIIQVVNVLFYVTFRLIDLPPTFRLSIPPMGVFALLLVFGGLAALLAALLLAVSGRTSSYKEAQLIYFPVFVVCVVLALSGALPEVTSRSAICLMPVANTGIAVKEIFVGRYDWPFLLLGVVANLLMAAWLISYTTRMLTSEELVTQGEGASSLDREEHFGSRVLGWYGLMAAALLVIPPNVEPLAGLTGQVLFNQLVLFGLGPLLMIRAYGLDFRKALAFRPFKPAVLLAVLLLIPSSQLAATGLGILIDKVLPMPRSMAEEMAKLLLPENVSLGWLIVMIAILPGIFEELAFRGLLLYGLRRRLRPLALALTVGLIFGLFHMSIYRILPTAFIGTLLTAVALLTGSIFPGMLAHVGNNALGVWAFRNDLSFTEFPTWVYFLAVAMQGLAFYILYRNRTPYPGLLAWRKPTTETRSSP